MSLFVDYSYGSHFLGPRELPRLFSKSQLVPARTSATIGNQQPAIEDLLDPVLVIEKSTHAGAVTARNSPQMMNTRSATFGHPRSLTYTGESETPCSACRRLINAVIFEDFDNKNLWGKGTKRWKLFFKLHYTKLSEIRESAEAC